MQFANLLTASFFCACVHFEVRGGLRLAPLACLEDASRRLLSKKPDHELNYGCPSIPRIDRLLKATPFAWRYENFHNDSFSFLQTECSTERLTGVDNALPTRYEAIIINSISNLKKSSGVSSETVIFLFAQTALAGLLSTLSAGSSLPRSVTPRG